VAKPYNASWPSLVILQITLLFIGHVKLRNYVDEDADFMLENRQSAETAAMKRIYRQHWAYIDSRVLACQVRRAGWGRDYSTPACWNVSVSTNAFRRLLRSAHKWSFSVPAINLCSL